MANNQRRTITPYQLRSLVLDYLCHSCYTNTARAFNRESTIRHLDADGDELLIAPPPIDAAVERSDAAQPTRSSEDNERIFDKHMKKVELRRDIRIEILSGRVDNAIALLNQHFPAVLSEDTAIKLSANDEPRPSTSNLEYVSSTSTEPAHLLLNLRILAFSEACRTVPLEYPPKSKSAEAKSKDSMSMDIDGTPANLPAAAGSASSMEQQMALLARAQKLYAFSKALPNPSDRATYQKELENVSGLLAYPVPEKSIMAKYLTLERREAVADQINRAILKRNDRPLVSTVELLTRYTYLLWEAANQQRVKARPSQVLPPRPKAVHTTAENDNEQIVPIFDLHTFLEAKP